MGPVINVEKLIKDYQDGVSMNKLACAYSTYPTTIKRILEKNNIKLRHDSRKSGEFYVEDGEKLIKWAKAQGRLVTKEELAAIIGKARLSPSYFIKYPELGQYIATRGQKYITNYINELFNWLQKNNILYKPHDRKALGAYVTALLLNEYENIALIIDIKPKNISKKIHNEIISKKIQKGKEKNLTLIYLNQKHFENLDCIKELLQQAKEQ